ncbi:hypothetical protein DL765_011269 [Monosporascus sp. GIB2]|nr:hypothetical protein DL765_011269 [Monosporascus sp. GIB2]
MTRARQTVSIALLFTSVRKEKGFPITAPIAGNWMEVIPADCFRAQLYLALFLQLVPLPPVVQSEIVPVLPFWALVSFGAYLLFRLGWNVMTFNDVPEAHKELMAEIDLAKSDLRKLGVDVD